MSKPLRRRLALYRKAALREGRHSFASFSQRAAVSYSMAEKWANARRGSERCDRAFEAITGKPASPMLTTLPTAPRVRAGAL